MADKPPRIFLEKMIAEHVRHNHVPFELSQWAQSQSIVQT